MVHHRRLVFGGLAWVGIALVAPALSYVLLFRHHTPQTANATTADSPPAVVTPGQESSAAEQQSAAIGFHIRLPQFVPGGASHLVVIVTTAEAGATKPNRFPEATLRYDTPSAKPGDISALRVEVHEVNVPVAAPTAPAKEITVAGGSPYRLYTEETSENGTYVDVVYTFDTKTNMVAIVFSGGSPPSVADVVRMYDSLK
jgi:hypothetical protein